MLSFTVAVKKAENGSSIAVRQMVLKDVPTHEERSDKPDGEDWTFTNSAKITQDDSTKATDSAEDVYRSSVFEKSVAIDGKRDNYITGNTTVSYDQVQNQKLLYRIKLVTTGTETDYTKDGKILIEDTLPEETELTVSRDKLKLCVDNEWYDWSAGGRWHFCKRSALRMTPAGRTCSHRMSPTPTKQNGAISLRSPSRPRCTRILFR